MTGQRRSIRWRSVVRPWPSTASANGSWCCAATCRHLTAGDLAALANALVQAADDPELDRQIMVVNTALHSEAGIRPLAEPAALAARHSHNGKLFTETVGAAAAGGPDAGAQSRSLRTGGQWPAEKG